MKYYDCGIDLGTTNSCVAIPIQDSLGYSIIKSKGKATTPSAVFVAGNGKMYIGDRAYKMFDDKDPRDLSVQFKRKMGTDDVILFPSSDVRKTPEELSSEILKKLKEDVQREAGRDIENVVITVPAAFTTLQCEATKRAGAMAGFQNVLLLQEPIAASIAYGASPDAESKDKNWMVFDYGGGTLDVAIISTAGGCLSVLNTEGDNFCGGSDLDRLIYKQVILPELKKSGYIVDQLLNEKTTEGRANVRKLQKICEDCKKELTNANSCIIEIFDLIDDVDNDIDFEYTLTREEFNAIIAPTIEKCILLAQKSLEGADKAPSDLHKVVLVGGSTRVPLVKELLEEAFGEIVDGSIDPMTVVAVGAALFSGKTSIQGDVCDCYVNDAEMDELEGLHVRLVNNDITSEELFEVIGRLEYDGNTDGFEVQIQRTDIEEFSNITWVSEWTEFLDDEGTFDVDVEALLSDEGVTNRYCILIRDASGKLLKINNSVFVVKGITSGGIDFRHVSTSTCSIGVKVADASGKDMLDVLILKNSLLPVSATRIYRTTKKLDPEVDSSIVIEIYEGENRENPTANHSAGCITIMSTAMKEVVSEGTEIEITLTEDEERTLTVSGYIPELDYVIPSRSLRDEERSRINMEMQLDNARKELKKLEDAVELLKKAGIDTSDIESSCEEARKTLNHSGDDGELHRTVSSLHDTGTAVEKKMVELQNRDAAAHMDSECNSIEQNINAFGDDSAKDTFAQLLNEYCEAKEFSEKQVVLTRMRRLHYNVVMNSFDWLKRFFLNVQNSSMNYRNMKRADILKENALDAINKNDVDELRKAVQSLMDLRSTGPKTSQLVYHSDIMF